MYTAERCRTSAAAAQAGTAAAAQPAGNMSSPAERPGSSFASVLLVLLALGGQRSAEAVAAHGRGNARPGGQPGARSQLSWRRHALGQTSRCQHAAVTYISSELEQLWLDNVKEWQDPSQYCKQQMKQQASINALARAVAAVEASPKPAE